MSADFMSELTSYPSIDLSSLGIQRLRVFLDPVQVSDRSRLRDGNSTHLRPLLEPCPRVSFLMQRILAGQWLELSVTMKVTATLWRFPNSLLRLVFRRFVCNRRNWCHCATISKFGSLFSIELGMRIAWSICVLIC